MTRDERQAHYDAARLALGDVQMDPDSSEADVIAATEAVKRAELMLRGVPGTLLGLRRTA